MRGDNGKSRTIAIHLLLFLIISMLVPSIEIIIVYFDSLVGKKRKYRLFIENLIAVLSLFSCLLCVCLTWINHASYRTYLWRKKKGDESDCTRVRNPLKGRKVQGFVYSSLVVTNTSRPLVCVVGERRSGWSSPNECMGHIFVLLIVAWVLVQFPLQHAGKLDDEWVHDFRRSLFPLSIICNIV